MNHNMARQLSAREREVLFLIVQEYKTDEIAEFLDVSLETIKTHRRNLMNKMQVRNVAGLVRRAVEERMVKN